MKNNRMDVLSGWIIGSGENKEKKNMLWNMCGSFCYAFASMVLSFLVMGMIGKEQGGIFAFAFSTFGQQMFIVAYFGIRPYQVTDGDYEYSFGDYLYHRRITCLAALILGLLYLFVSGYTFHKAAVVFLMVMYKVIDGFADVYESEFQRSGNLYLTGKSNTFRTLLSVGSFLIVLMFTRNLVIACVAAVMAQAAGVLLFNIRVIRHLEPIDWTHKNGHSRALFQSTLLLFISVFLDFYIFSAAKYAIDARLNDAASGYFNVIFMPTSVINLVAGFVIRPFLTTLTGCWNQGKLSDFKRQLLRIGTVIGGLTILAAGLTWLLGKPVLRLLEMILGGDYTGRLSVYHVPFFIIVLGGGFYAVLNLMYYALVIMRRQKSIFVVYVLVSITAFLMSGPMVSAYGINGAAFAYLILMMLLAMGFGLLVLAVFHHTKIVLQRHD